MAEPAAADPVKKARSKFPRTYWVVIVMELFERFAFYGMMAFLADYFVEHVGSHKQFGALRTVLFMILYIVPILSGALAEKVGYKKVLGVAFLLMGAAYLGVGRSDYCREVLASVGFENMTAVPFFFTFMIILGLGGGLFKPIISGTIARSTDATNSTVGFGIYYWSINVGSFLASLVAAHYVEQNNEEIMFIFAAVCAGLMLFNNFFFYREPSKPGKIKSFADTASAIGTVFANWRFIVLLVIFSGFWAMYNRSQDSALWLLSENYLDMTPVNDFVTSIGVIFHEDFRFNFNVAHVMTINAGVIILLQVVVSYLVRNTPPLPTMIVGIGLATTFPLITALSTNPWLFVLGLVLFSIGEITAYPKLISYVGLIAPRDKVAIYMGFVFLPIFFAAMFFDIPNGWVWDELVVKNKDITTYWYIVAGLGAFTMVCLILYHKLLGKKLTFDE